MRKTMACNKLRAFYRNYRGEVTCRIITPKEIVFESNDWHSEQWILRAFDHAKGEDRSFALVDFLFPMQIVREGDDDE